MTTTMPASAKSSSDEKSSKEADSDKAGKSTSNADVSFFNSLHKHAKAFLRRFDIHEDTTKSSTVLPVSFQLSELDRVGSNTGHRSTFSVFTQPNFDRFREKHLKFGKKDENTEHDSQTLDILKAFLYHDGRFFLDCASDLPQRFQWEMAKIAIQSAPHLISEIGVDGKMKSSSTTADSGTSTGKDKKPLPTLKELSQGTSRVLMCDEVPTSGAVMSFSVEDYLELDRRAVQAAKVLDEYQDSQNDSENSDEISSAQSESVGSKVRQYELTRAFEKTVVMANSKKNVADDFIDIIWNSVEKNCEITPTMANLLRSIRAETKLLDGKKKESGAKNGSPSAFSKAGANSSGKSSSSFADGSRDEPTGSSFLEGRRREAHHKEEPRYHEQRRHGQKRGLLMNKQRRRPRDDEERYDETQIGGRREPQRRVDEEEPMLNDAQYRAEDVPQRGRDRVRIQDHGHEHRNKAPEPHRKHHHHEQQQSRSEQQQQRRSEQQQQPRSEQQQVQAREQKPEIKRNENQPHHHHHHSHPGHRPNSNPTSNSRKQIPRAALPPAIADELDRDEPPESKLRFLDRNYSNLNNAMADGAHANWATPRLQCGQKAGSYFAMEMRSSLSNSKIVRKIIEKKILPIKEDEKRQNAFVKLYSQLYINFALELHDRLPEYEKALFFDEKQRAEDEALRMARPLHALLADVNTKMVEQFPMLVAIIRQDLPQVDTSNSDFAKWKKQRNVKTPGTVQLPAKLQHVLSTGLRKVFQKVVETDGKLIRLVQDTKLRNDETLLESAVTSTPSAIVFANAGFRVVSNTGKRQALKEMAMGMIGDDADQTSDDKQTPQNPEVIQYLPFPWLTPNRQRHVVLGEKEFNRLMLAPAIRSRSDYLSVSDTRDLVSVALRVDPKVIKYVMTEEAVRWKYSGASGAPTAKSSGVSGLKKDALAESESACNNQLLEDLFDYAVSQDSSILDPDFFPAFRFAPNWISCWRPVAARVMDGSITSSMSSGSNSRGQVFTEFANGLMKFGGGKKISGQGDNSSADTQELEFKQKTLTEFVKKSPELMQYVFPPDTMAVEKGANGKENQSNNVSKDEVRFLDLNRAGKKYWEGKEKLQLLRKNISSSRDAGATATDDTASIYRDLAIEAVQSKGASLEFVIQDGRIFSPETYQDLTETAIANDGNAIYFVDYPERVKAWKDTRKLKLPAPEHDEGQQKISEETKEAQKTSDRRSEEDSSKRTTDHEKSKQVDSDSETASQEESSEEASFVEFDSKSRMKKTTLQHSQKNSFLEVDDEVEDPDENIPVNLLRLAVKTSPRILLNAGQIKDRRTGKRFFSPMQYFEAAKTAIKSDVVNLQFVSSDFFEGDAASSYRSLVRSALSQSGLALQYASDELRDDRAIVTLAVQSDSNAIRFASEKLRTDLQKLAKENDPDISFRHIEKEAAEDDRKRNNRKIRDKRELERVGKLLALRKKLIVERGGDVGGSNDGKGAGSGVGGANSGDASGSQNADDQISDGEISTDGKRVSDDDGCSGGSCGDGEKTFDRENNDIEPDQSDRESGPEKESANKDDDVAQEKLDTPETGKSAAKKESDDCSSFLCEGKKQLDGEADDEYVEETREQQPEVEEFNEPDVVPGGGLHESEDILDGGEDADAIVDDVSDEVVTSEQPELQSDPGLDGEDYDTMEDNSYQRVANIEGQYPDEEFPISFLTKLQSSGSVLEPAYDDVSLWIFFPLFAAIFLFWLMKTLCRRERRFPEKDQSLQESNSKIWRRLCQCRNSSPTTSIRTHITHDLGSDQDSASMSLLEGDIV